MHYYRFLLINAFSAPGGHIYLTCGLLRFAETEDEVAGIIGHEVAHASLRHASKLYSEVMKYYGHKMENNAISGLLLLNSHLEEFEVDADAVGVLYAQKADLILVDYRIFGKTFRRHSTVEDVWRTGLQYYYYDQL